MSEKKFGPYDLSDLDATVHDLMIEELSKLDSKLPSEGKAFLVILRYDTGIPSFPEAKSRFVVLPDGKVLPLAKVLKG